MLDPRVEKIKALPESEATALLYQWVKTGVLSLKEFKDLLKTRWEKK